MENSSLPTGIVTFLFTDIEGSTPLWESRPGQMSVALQIHNSVLRQAIQANGGGIFKFVGDSVQAAFPTASQALQAAVAAQRALQTAAWNEVGPLKVRMGLHAGEAELDPGGDEYAVSHTKNRVARIMSAGHGGQILISQTVAEFIGSQLPRGLTLKDLGEHHLKGLHHPEHLFQVLSPDIPSDFPPLATNQPQSNLPLQSTPFFGREAELEKIEGLLKDPDCRLITLVGIGGTGKSRLAIEAARLNHAYQGRVYFVGLASITTLDGMISAVAEALQYSFFTPPGVNLTALDAQAQLLRYLSGRKALLVLDNFEQLACCSALLNDFLSAAPHIKFLVTSRERMNLPGEWVIEVSGLPFPALPHIPVDSSRFAAVQLFIKAAERTGNLNLSDQDWPAIVHICRLLEGIPLGLEMAAASLKILSIAEIGAEIERSLDFLAATWRSVPERHQTLRAVFETSWRLLTPQEQETFRRLSIFRGGFHRAAAAQVAKASLPILSALVDKSFIRRQAAGRFEIHPVLEHYAQEKLSEDPTAQNEVRAMHAHFFSSWLIRMFTKLQGQDQIAALAELRVEAQNIRAAFKDCIEQDDFESLGRMLPAVILFFDMNNLRIETAEMLTIMADMEQHLRKKLLLPGAAEDTNRRILYQGILALTLAATRHFGLDTQDPLSTSRMQESLQLAQALPDTSTKASAQLLICRGPGLESDHKLELCQQSFVIFKHNHDRWGEALTQLIWADEMNFSGYDLSMAQIAYQASLKTFVATRNNWGQALCLYGLMVIEQKAGDFDQANNLANQSIELFKELKNFERISWLHHSFGEFAAASGHPQEARNHFEANITYFTHMGDTQRRHFYENCLSQLNY